jgi:hypothetical protein
METCRVCGGSGICSTCNGTGSVKELDTHPSPGLIGDDGSVTCFACGGNKRCGDCDGKGKVPSDD